VASVGCVKSTPLQSAVALTSFPFAQADRRAKTIRETPFTCGCPPGRPCECRAVRARGIFSLPAAPVDAAATCRPPSPPLTLPRDGQVEKQEQQQESKEARKQWRDCGKCAHCKRNEAKKKKLSAKALAKVL